MSVPYNAVGDAAEKRICSARLTVTAHDNKIGEPLFSAIQDQSLRRSVVHDEFEFSLSPPRDFGDARSRCFGGAVPGSSAAQASSSTLGTLMNT